MKTFRVWLTFTQHDWVEVKAETLDDAFEVAWDWEAQNFPKGEELARLFPQIVDWNQIGYSISDRYPDLFGRRCDSLCYHFVIIRLGVSCLKCPTLSIVYEYERQKG